MASRTTALLIITTAMAVVVVSAMLLATASATTYKVGDVQGWVPDVDYSVWTNGKAFKAGDQLQFVYSTDDEHNVVQVMDQASFEACTVPQNAFMVSTGNDIVPLSSQGEYFFISSMNDDCQSGGMKVAVNVAL